jgi:hypothetical protein
VENTQHPYLVLERHRVNGDRYYTVYFNNILVAQLRSKRAAEEYIELNKKYVKK